MSTQQSVTRDERTVAVENASYRWAFTFTIFALFIEVACRAMFFHEAAWDLLALAIVPGFVCTIYQYRQKTLSRPSRKIILFRLVMAIVTAVVAAIIVAMTKAM